VSSDAYVTSEVHRTVRSLKFDSWNCDDAELILLLRHMFIDLDLHHKCNIDVRTDLDLLPRKQHIAT